MHEELQQIDTSPIDALEAIRKQRVELEELLDKAKGGRDKVSAKVYERVTADYHKRLEALDSEARPLRQKARSEQGRLRPIHTRLAQALEAARLDAEEITFRHEVGELPDTEFAEKRDAAAETVTLRERDFAEADALLQRFAEVLPAGAEPEAEPAPPPAPEPVVAQAEEVEEEGPPTTKPMAAPPELRAGAPAPPPPPGGQAEETLYLTTPMSVGEPAAPPAEEGTLTLGMGTLQVEGDPSREYVLGPRTTIGRTQDNSICLAFSNVSRHHAVIELTEAGCTLKDQKSGNGTFVNDQRVRDHVLADGDRIRIGDTVFLFRAPQ